MRVWHYAGGSAVLLLLFVGGMMYRDGSAKDELASAEARLSATLREVPELHELEAGEALQEIERAERLGSEAAGLRHYAKALEDLRNGDLIFCEGNLSTARHHLGWTADLRVLAGTLARLKGDRDTARDHVAGALSREERHARAHLLNADLALDAGDAQAARRSLRVLLEVAPRAAVVRNRFGLAEELAGSDDNAERRFREAVELDPMAHNAFINLGRVRARRGAREEAVAAYSRAIEINVGDADAWLGRGLVRMELMEAEAAEVDLSRAAELDPRSALPRLALGDLVASSDPTRAVEIYRDALAIEDDGSELAYVKLGNALLRGGEAGDAQRAFEEAIRRRPSSAAAHNGLGAALMRSDDRESALAPLERAAELDENDPHPLMNIALVREEVGDEEGARRAWEQALLRDPASEYALRGIARLAEG